MTYLATYTESNASPVVVGEYYTLADSCNACRSHLSASWEATHGTYKALDPRHSYDRGQFAQWNGVSRIYVTAPNNNTAHYDIAGIHR